MRDTTILAVAPLGQGLLAFAAPIYCSPWNAYRRLSGNVKLEFPFFSVGLFATFKFIYFGNIVLPDFAVLHPDKIIVCFAGFAFHFSKQHLISNCQVVVDEY